jgi:hypothetical protein
MENSSLRIKQRVKNAKIDRLFSGIDLPGGGGVL